MCKDEMEGYRYLEVGEVIKEGDESLTFRKTWIPTSHSTEDQCRVREDFIKGYRRKIKGDTPSLAVLNEKVEDIIQQVKEIKEAQKKSDESHWFDDEGYLYYNGRKWKKLKVDEYTDARDICLDKGKISYNIDAIKRLGNPYIFPLRVHMFQRVFWRDVRFETKVEEKQWRDVKIGEIIQEGFEVQHYESKSWEPCTSSIGSEPVRCNVSYYRAPKNMKPIFKKAETIEVPANLLDIPSFCDECICPNSCLEETHIYSDKCLANLFLMARNKLKENPNESES